MSPLIYHTNIGITESFMFSYTGSSKIDKFICYYSIPFSSQLTDDLRNCH